MEVKKNDKVNIEKTKGLYFNLGLLIVLSLSLIAFEWSGGPNGINEYYSGDGEVLDTEIIQRTTQDQEKPREKPKMPNIIEIFEIVDNDVLLNDSIVFPDDDTKIDEKIPFYKTIRIEDEPDFKEDDVFVVVEEMPKFKGGDKNTFARWVQSNVHYPQIPAENGVYGKVFVEFIVEPDGSISNINVTRNVDPDLDAEAVRAISNSPKWLAGKQQGTPVRVRFTITVNFQLQ